MSEHQPTPTTEVRVTVNDETYVRQVADRKLLIHFLREDLGLTGSHQGCVVGKCGACTVLHDGTPKKSCMLYAVQVDGDEITTVEGLSDIAEREGTAMETRGGTSLHPLQMGFKQNHGLQCGFCTPGFLMTGYAFLEAADDPDRDEIESAISGNICRCTGYSSIVESIEWAADTMNGGSEQGPPTGDPSYSADGGMVGCPCADATPTPEDPQE
jgi:carbon-monoxide dehydrogenase small subunit